MTDSSELEGKGSVEKSTRKKHGRKRMGLREIIERWKLYTEITELGEIARRYFVMNFFDGVLTVLGIIIGNFVLYISGVHISAEGLFLPAISVSFAIGISGMSGGYLAERAERNAEVNEMKKYLLLKRKIRKGITKRTEPYEGKTAVSGYGGIPSYLADEPAFWSTEDGTSARSGRNSNPKTDSGGGRSDLNRTESEKLYGAGPSEKNTNGKPRAGIEHAKKIEKESSDTLIEKAQRFATNMASLINGLAPAAGGIASIIPMMFFPEISMISFIAAFIGVAVILFLLGLYLARISHDRPWKYGLGMIGAGLLTSLITLLLGV